MFILQYYNVIAAAVNSAPVFQPFSGQFRKRFNFALPRPATNMYYSSLSAPATHPETNVLCMGYGQIPSTQGVYAQNIASQLVFFTPDGTKMGEFQPHMGDGYTNHHIVSFGPAPGGRWFAVVNAKVGTTNTYQGFVVIIEAFNPSSVNSLAVLAVYRLNDPAQGTGVYQAHCSTGVIEAEKSVQDNSDVYTLLVYHAVYQGNCWTMITFNTNWQIKNTNSKRAATTGVGASIIDTFSTKEATRPFGLLTPQKRVMVASRNTLYVSAWNLVVRNCTPNTTYSITGRRTCKGTIERSYTSASTNWEPYSVAEPDDKEFQTFTTSSPTSITTDANGNWEGPITLNEYKPQNLNAYTTYTYTSTQMNLYLKGTLDGQANQTLRINSSAHSFGESGTQVDNWLPMSGIYHHKVKIVLVSVPLQYFAFPYDEPNNQGLLELHHAVASYTNSGGYELNSTYTASINCRGKQYYTGHFQVTTEVKSPREKVGDVYHPLGFLGGAPGLVINEQPQMTATNQAVGMGCTWGDTFNFSNVIGSDGTMFYYAHRADNATMSMASSANALNLRAPWPGICWPDRTKNAPNRGIFQVVFDSTTGGTFSRFKVNHNAANGQSFDISAAGTGTAYKAGPWSMVGMPRATWPYHKIGDAPQPPTNFGNGYTYAVQPLDRMSANLSKRALITDITTLSSD